MVKECERRNNIEPGLVAEGREVCKVRREPALRRCSLDGQSQERQAGVDPQIFERELCLFEKMEKPAVAASRVQEMGPSLRR